MINASDVKQLHFSVRLMKSQRARALCPVACLAPAMDSAEASPHVSLPKHEYRGLLALDGQHLPAALLKRAQRLCARLADKIDILLINPPASPTSTLSELLISLEKSGTDYEVTMVNGDFGDQVGRYLRRFLGIRLILMDANSLLEHGLRTRISNLCQQGYRLVPLAS